MGLAYKTIKTLITLFFLLPSLALAADYPATPPKIGHLIMPQEYWIYVLGASRDYGVRPAVITGFMVIESRYDPRATSGRGKCIGLMQLNRDVARGLVVNPWNPRENIRGGARILARLMKKHGGNLRLVARAYNCTGDRSYEREVLRAIRQAESQE